jgi:hypothetical protein
VSVGHAVALRTMPTESLQGAAELAVIWAGTRLVVAEVRRAAWDAQEASEAARQAEREEASARVHDALGLLRVVARGDGAGAGLQRAAQETARRTEVWLQDSSGGPTLAQAIAAVIGQFPDLDVALDVTRLSAPADSSVVTAVGRAVHTLLGNVREHAGAARVDIMAVDAPGGWILRIRDNGRGFDVAATTPGGGLSRYTHAALNAVGVVMNLVSAPGAGTTVTLQASSSGAPTDPPQHGRAGRFAAWRARPAGGLARAAWISDVMQAALVASFAVMVMTGYPHLLGHSQRPTGAGALVAAGAVLLTVTWLGGPRPPRVLAVAATVVAVAAGGVITVLNGPEPMVGDKLGIVLMAWSCMLLAAARPEYRWISVGLAVVPLAVFGHVDVISGLVGALLVVMGSLVAARLVSALTDLGSEADRDRHRAADSERRSAARLLYRQAAVISDAATTTATDQLADRLAAVAKQAEHYLRPPRECTLGAGLQAGLGALPAFGDRLDLDVTHLDADLAPDPVGRIVAAVTEIASTLLRAASTGRVSVRAVGEAARWQLTLLAELDGDRLAHGPQPTISIRVGADLAAAGVALTTRVMPGGDGYVELRPSGPETRQETAAYPSARHRQSWSSARAFRASSLAEVGERHSC